MATTKKLSFGLDKAGGAALILARIGAALLWIIAALAAVVWVVFLISPRSFAVVPEFLRTLVFARPRGDDQFADCTFSPSLDMSR